MAWPDNRVGGYDADTIWDEKTKAWIAADGRNTTAYQNQIVVVGMDPDDSNKRVIYFGATA